MTALLLAALLAAPAAAQTAPSAAPDLSSAAVAAVSTSAATAVLDELVATALVRAISLRSARLDAVTARAASGVAEAPFDPRFDAALTKTNAVTRLRTAPDVLSAPFGIRSHSASASLSKKTSIGTDLAVGASATGQSTDPLIKRYDGAVTVSGTQQLLDGAWRAGAYAAAKQALLAARGADETLYRSYETTIAAVERSYWSLRRAEARRAAALASKLNSEHLLRRNQELNRRKLMSDFDVIVAESGAYSRRAADTDAVRARADAVDALVYLVFGEDAPRTLKPDFDLATSSASSRAIPDVPSEAEAEALALSSRRDLVAARLAFESAGVARRAAVLGLWPSLAVNGSYSSAGAAQTGQQGDFSLSLRDAYRGGRGSSWTAGLTLGVPLGNVGDRARLSAADAELERRRLALADAENAVRQETRAARRALLAAASRSEDARRAEELAVKQLQGEYRRLDLNLVDSFRVLQEVDTLTQARLTAADAQFELLDAATRWDLAIGRIGERYSQTGAPR